MAKGHDLTGKSGGPGGNPFKPQSPSFPTNQSMSPDQQKKAAAQAKKLPRGGTGPAGHPSGGGAKIPTGVRPKV
jgi:hypothetical protein